MPAMMSAKPGSGVVTNNVANALLKDPGAIKVFLSTWSNFVFSATGAQRWEKVMAKMPFFVHMVTNASEMSQYADIVLPATFAPTEKFSIISNMANLHGHISIQQPVIKLLYRPRPRR
jgi:anaerobic selenocysteine-containing dehydrogenase